MRRPSLDDYVDASVARLAADAGPEARPVEGTGVRGFVTPATVQLVVVDDRAEEQVAGLPAAARGLVRVHEWAVRCADVLVAQGWRPSPVTAMVCPDLRALPPAPLPEGLTLRPVRRVEADPPGGVPLEEMVEAVRRASDDVPESLAAYLRNMPGDPSILVAVDDDGVVRGTSASRAIAQNAYVFAVNTDPGWRRRGVGLAMTAIALQVAGESGATRACLDAGGIGVPLYERLGFAAVAGFTQYSR